MRYIKVVILLIFFGSNLFAQEQQMNCASTIAINQKALNFNVFKYPEKTKASKLKSFKKVKNRTPEELMSSVLSASNLEWYNYNREVKKDKSSQDFNYIKQANSDFYYFQLLYRIEFKVNGFNYAIVKYTLFDNDKEPKGFAEAMKLNDGKWVTTDEAQVFQLLFFMGMIDVAYIDSIFNQKKSDNSKLNQIMESNTTNGIININGVLTDLETELTDSKASIESILDANRLFK